METRIIPTALIALDSLNAYMMRDPNNGSRYLPLTPEQVEACLARFTVREWQAMAQALIALADSESA